LSKRRCSIVAPCWSGYPELVGKVSRHECLLCQRITCQLVDYVSAGSMKDLHDICVHRTDGWQIFVVADDSKCWRKGGQYANCINGLRPQVDIKENVLRLRSKYSSNNYRINGKKFLEARISSWWQEKNGTGQLQMG
jgi:hypothetical protein